MKITHEDILKLKRWNTPTIYNGWEIISDNDRTGPWFNREETRDFMPAQGPMAGRAVTVQCEPSNKSHAEREGVWQEYYAWMASQEGPKIVVVQDLDKPNHVGAFWGEVNSNIHRALGCVGTITDGAVRDVDEMMNAGFKALASRMCVGHAWSVPVRWGCEVEVFGCPVRTGDLIHGDKHGFMRIPEEDQERLLEAVLFMDNNECNTVIPAARSSAGQSREDILAAVADASRRFGEAATAFAGKKGEW